MQAKAPATESLRRVERHLAASSDHLTKIHTSTSHPRATITLFDFDSLSSVVANIHEIDKLLCPLNFFSPSDQRSIKDFAALVPSSTQDRYESEAAVGL
jgi:hypothetical protein